MDLRSLFLVLFASGTLLAQEEVAARDQFPVRLTPQEEQGKARARGCCPPPSSDCCPPACCKPPSINCPPLMPYCNPCDCIIDYYPPLIFTGIDCTLEFLYWTVQQKASTFALTPNGIHQPFPPSSLADSIGKYKSASFDWSPGFRLGLGYTFERDAWHVFGQYTWYTTSGKNRATRPTDPTLYLEATNRELSNSSDGVDLLISKTNFHYQMADLLLARRYLPACQILFNFFTGGTAAWIHEKWKVNGFDITGASPNVADATQNNWKFKGGGIRGGLDVNWHMGAGFGLYNKVSFAGLVGSYRNSRKTSVAPAGISGTLTPNVRNTTESDIWVVPHSQLELGLNWNHRFCTWSMALQAAFEINTWYDLHQLHQDATGFSLPNNDRLDIRNASDVKLWGLTVSGDFSF